MATPAPISATYSSAGPSRLNRQAVSIRPNSPSPRMIGRPLDGGGCDSIDDPPVGTRSAYCGRVPRSGPVGGSARTGRGELLAELLQLLEPGADELRMHAIGVGGHDGGDGQAAQ